MKEMYWVQNPMGVEGVGRGRQEARSENEVERE